jgi:hypothetical protein
MASRLLRGRHATAGDAIHDSEDVFVHAGVRPGQRRRGTVLGVVWAAAIDIGIALIAIKG